MTVKFYIIFIYHFVFNLCQNSFVVFLWALFVFVFFYSEDYDMFASTEQ